MDRSRLTFGERLAGDPRFALSGHFPYGWGSDDPSGLRVDSRDRSGTGRIDARGLQRLYRCIAKGSTGPVLGIGPGRGRKASLAHRGRSLAGNVGAPLLDGERSSWRDFRPLLP